MHFLKLMWSFVRHADLWLELFEKYNWVPEDDFSDNPMYSELAKKKTRTMWEIDVQRSTKAVDRG